MIISINELIDSIKKIPPGSDIYMDYKKDKFSIDIVIFCLISLGRSAIQISKNKKIKSKDYLFISYLDSFESRKIKKIHKHTYEVYFLCDENGYANFFRDFYQQEGKSLSLNSLKINEVFILDYARKFSMITDIENLSLAKRKLKLFLHKKGYILKKEFPFLERLYFFDRKNTPWNVFFKGYAWFHDSKKVDKFYSQIIGNLLIFSDEKSILQYKAIFSGNPRAIFSTYVNNLFERPQYCEFLNVKNYNVLNIGVHLGYEIPIFLKMIGNKGHLVNVDPGGNKYIDKRIKPLVGDNHISFIYEFVGDGSLVRYQKRKDNQFVVKNNKMDFSHDKNDKSFGYANSKTFDEVVKLSKVKKFNFIKIDIEGAEDQIIDSVFNYSKHNRACLAISIYHKLSHYLTFPMLFSKLDNTSLFFRCYSLTPGEGVLYVIPNEYLSKKLPSNTIIM